MGKFNTILIANRGEIAVRIMHTARSLGYRTIAVYSDADAGAAHVSLADEAVLIGPAPVGESYLDMEKIISAARDTGADAIHPGYGFLSENAAFARACIDAGLVFIGPPADAIELMGNKAAAKRRMIGAGVPCVPGYEEEDQSDAAFTAAAEKLGFPIMVKAAAGGGGRGMRRVDDASALAEALASARSEAMNAFGSDELILEKAIVEPRHVEFQVFADTVGNVIHLGERDCSVQRRHQKVIEETPCPVMTDDLRNRMGDAAVEAARSIGYVGAGTVEFLLDADGRFYFLEMNTRLQVEHPVTEMISGLDLVAMQIRTAQGDPLRMAQEDVVLSGHAIEARLYAEDPGQDFLPCVGTVDAWNFADGPGLRVDSGITAGQDVSPFYDPLLAKVIAWGEDRDAARRRLADALRRTVLFGLTTNQRFLIDVLENPVFAAGRATTGFIETAFTVRNLEAANSGSGDAAVAAVLQFVHDRDHAHARSLGMASELLNWSSGKTLVSHVSYTVEEERIEVSVAPAGNERYSVRVGEIDHVIDQLAIEDGWAHLDLDGRRLAMPFHVTPPRHVSIANQGRVFSFQDHSAESGVDDMTADGRIVAPMHGAVIDVFADVGEEVSAGTRLAVLEAMKMQHDILASVDGTISRVSVKAGDQIAADAHMFSIEDAER